MGWVWRHPTPPGLHGYIGSIAVSGAPAEGLLVWAERWTGSRSNGRRNHRC